MNLDEVVNNLSEFINKEINNKILLDATVSGSVKPLESKYNGNKFFMNFYINIEQSDFAGYNYFTAQHVTNRNMSIINKSYSFNTSLIIDSIKKKLTDPTYENEDNVKNILEHLLNVLNTTYKNCIHTSQCDMANLGIVAEWLRIPTIRVKSILPATAEGGVHKIKPRFVEKMNVCGRSRNIYKEGKQLYIKHKSEWILLKDCIKKMKKKQKDITFF
jgi:hypothetical protein